MDARCADRCQCSRLARIEHLFRFPTSGTGCSHVGAGGGGSVSRRTMVGLPLLVKVRYSSTGRYGDELNTGCGAAW